jgi:hypothetical protein
MLARDKLATAQANGSTIGYSADQNAYAATWSALADLSSTAATPNDRLNAQLAMSALNAASGGDDASAGLRAIKSGLGTVEGVQKQLDSMANTVNPVVADTLKGADDKLNPKASNDFSNKVGSHINTHRGIATSGNQSTENGLNAVKKEGRVAADKAKTKVGGEQSKIMDHKSLDTQAKNAFDNVAAKQTVSNAIRKGGDTISGSSNLIKTVASQVGHSVAGAGKGAVEATTNSAAQVANSTSATTTIVANQSAAVAGSIPDLGLKDGLNLSGGGNVGNSTPPIMFTEKTAAKPYTSSAGKPEAKGEKNIPKR